MTYRGVMRDAAPDVEVLEELWGASILPRDLLPDLGCHGPAMTQGQGYLRQGHGAHPAPCVLQWSQALLDAMRLSQPDGSRSCRINPQESPSSHKVADTHF